MRASARDWAIWRVCHLAPCGCISATQIDLAQPFSYRRLLTTLWRIRMKRIAVLMTMIACAASPAVAQWQGMPAWNNPKGGTGVTINGDVGVPNTDAGKGTAFGARGTLGLANISFTAGIASWKPKDAGASSTSVGGVAQFRLIGGSLIPVALNIQLGAGTMSAISDTIPRPKVTTILAGAGLSVNVPTPGLSIEPY